MLLVKILERVDGLEGRISFVHCVSVENGKAAGQTMDIAVESAMHLLERLLVTLQCLAADAGTISNAAAACKIETLVSSLMQGLQEPDASIAGGRHFHAAAALTVLRNATGASNKERIHELERQVALLQLQYTDSSSQLTAAASSAARLQRTLHLKMRAAASLERQLTGLDSELHQLRSSQAHNNMTIMQLQQELARSKHMYAEASNTMTVQAGELQAAVGRAAAAESQLQQLQQTAADAATDRTNLAEQMQQAVAAGRQDALEAKKAFSAAAAASLQAHQLQDQLTAAEERCCKLEGELKDSRQRADISVQSARDADFRSVQTTTLLADTRRALEYAQQLLQAANSKDTQTS